MSQFSHILASALVLVSLSAVSSGQSNPSPSGDPFLGRYEGTYKETGRENVAAVAEVIAEGRGLYRLRLDSDAVHLELHGAAAGPKLRFMGYSNNISWSGVVEDGKIRFGRSDSHYGGTFSFAKVIEHSPTEGLKPAKNATVLLGMTSGKADLSAWTNSKWESSGDGVMRVKGGSGDNKTKDTHANIRLHLEFKTALMASSSGQQRSNSGIYFQDRYEVQILDSFGVIPGSGDCGGIYEQSVAAVNVCYPPGQWQTYDITFTAARLDKDGKVKKYPTVTVEHNGVLIQDAHEFKKVTGGAVNDKVVEEARMRLQDHSNPVEYRNIWWVKD